MSAERHCNTMIDRAVATRVSVCACTFRRPDGLTRLLEGLRNQRFARVRPPVVAILVADNEGSARTAGICEHFRTVMGLPVHYLVEERRGISFARNRCLDEVLPHCEFIAMIDDDESPAADWLEQLLLAQGATGADVVQGRVAPVFADGAPAWIRDGGFFGYPLPPSPVSDPGEPQGAEPRSAATNNVLVRAAAIRDRDLRFDERMGLTGGGDSLFFRTLHAAGYRIVYAPDAVVDEYVPRARATLGYLWRRAFRNGTKRLWAKWLTKPEDTGFRGRIRLRLALRALAQGAAGVVWLLKSILCGRTDKARLAHGIVELANAAGTLAACAGVHYEIYRRA